MEWNYEEGYVTKNPKAIKSGGKKSGGNKRGPKAKKSSVRTVKKVSKTDNMVSVLQGLGVYEDIISAAFAKSVAVHQPKPTGKKRGPKAKAKKATTTNADRNKTVDKNKE